MMYELDSIPINTNSSEQLFGWFTIYNNHSIVYEHTNYAHIQYSSISKKDIHLFGMYGNGFKLASDFSDGSMYIYWNNRPIYTFRFLLSNKMIETKLSTHVYHCRPFHLKNFIYDFDVSNPISSNGYITNKYYSGYTGLILIDNSPLEIKQYFSIDISDHPREICIVTKIQKRKNVDYPKEDILFSIIENNIISKDSNKFSLLNDNAFKHKTIFKF